MSNRRIRRSQSYPQSPQPSYQPSQHSASQPYRSGQPVPPPANQSCASSTGDKREPVFDAVMTIKVFRLFKRLALLIAPTFACPYLIEAARLIERNPAEARHDLLVGLAELAIILLGLVSTEFLKGEINVSVAKLTPEHWLGNEQEFADARAYSQKRSGLVALPLGVLFGMLIGVYDRLLPSTILTLVALAGVTSLMAFAALDFLCLVSRIYGAIRERWLRRWNQQHGVDS